MVKQHKFLNILLKVNYWMAICHLAKLYAHNLAESLPLQFQEGFQLEKIIFLNKYRVCTELGDSGPGTPNSLCGYQVFKWLLWIPTF